MSLGGQRRCRIPEHLQQCTRCFSGVSNATSDMTRSGFRCNDASEINERWYTFDLVASNQDGSTIHLRGKMTRNNKLRFGDADGQTKRVRYFIESNKTILSSTERKSTASSAYSKSVTSVDCARRTEYRKRLSST